MKEHSILHKIRREFQADCEKVRGRSVWYKLEYFLMYYKISVLLTAAAAAVVISVIYSCSQHKEPAFYALFINAGNTLSDETFEQQFGKLAEINTDHYMITIDSSLSMDGNSQVSIASIEKFSANVNSKLLDVCMMPQDLFLIYAEEGCYGNLRDFLTEEQLEKYAEQMVYQDGIPVGIKADGFHKINEAELYTAGDRPIFGIVYNTGHKRECSLFLDFLAAGK